VLVPVNGCSDSFRGNVPPDMPVLGSERLAPKLGARRVSVITISRYPELTGDSAVAGEPHDRRIAITGYVEAWHWGFPNGRR
jgi:hypothetical protein